MTDLARRTATGAPYQRALLLEHLLRSRYHYWAKAPSGNGYVTLGRFLLAEPDKGGGRGTSEQFAASFALMARIVGLPSRIVVGFHAGRRTGPGRYEVRSRDAFAWPEVRFDGHGWVAFDPTPATGKGATPPDEDTPQARSRQKQKSRQLDDAAPDPSPGTPAPSASAHHAAAGTSDGGLPAGLGAGGAAVLLVLLAAGAVPVLRWRRSARRLTRGSAAARTVGAWVEVRDALRLAGAAPGRSLSAREVALLAAAPLPVASRRGGRWAPGGAASPLPDLAPLAVAVNAVTFAPEADAPGADWSGLVRAYRRALRGRLPMWRRLWWSLDPRPLFWRF